MMDTPLSMHDASGIDPTLYSPLCNLLSTMFDFGVDYLHPTKAYQHDLPSLAPPKVQMTSSFSQTFQDSHTKNFMFG